jgi:hypothetical protein
MTNPNEHRPPTEKELERLLYGWEAGTTDGETIHWLVAEVRALRSQLAALTPGGPREPDNSMVICPNCTHQFTAISVDDQARLAAAQAERDDAVKWIRCVAEELEVRGDRTVTLAAIRGLLRERDMAIQEAQVHAQEARTQRATVHETYQLCTGATGEPGDWHGAEPVRRVIQERDQYQADAERWRGLVELARPGQIVSISEDKGIWEISCEGVDPRAPIDIVQRADTPEAALDAALRERAGR